MTEVAIIGATFHGNKGAEAMLNTTIGMLRAEDPDLRFNVFSYYPAEDMHLVADEQVGIYSATPLSLMAVLNPSALLYRLLDLFRLGALQRLLPRSVQALARSRVLICLAGISFVDGRKSFLPFNIATLLPALVLRTPVVKFAQALGPFDEPLNAQLARSILARCNMIFARGDTTFAHLQHLLGPAGNYRRANDVAFLFKPEFSLSRPESEISDKLQRLHSLRPGGVRVVGICPSIVLAEEARRVGWDYTGMIANLIQTLSSKGFTIALFTNATRDRDPRHLHNNDLPVLVDILRLLPEDCHKQTVVFDATLNTMQVHEIIQACAVVAVSRFHAMVAALSLGVPVTVLGWSHKYLEVMRQFGQEDMVLSYEADPRQAAFDRIIRLVDERATRAKAIAQKLESARELAKIQIDYALSQIEESKLA